MKREHAVRLLFNDKEWKAIGQYCSDFGVSNRARWFRETIMKEVFSRFVQNAPMLFSEEEMK
ncbi:hypothetical protein HQ45_03695 [Porphyromonas crevioricanis]|uniref:Uncharacterized protein n=2 Tax=Porphyromonas crevioricanis TaxID=393921 RepID=A0A0A2G0W1_9PORP|nr:hypothetical protein [Porphyromonas crevioricanis]KGN89945.1 hypothetical protein HQ45_03695 [Porphyromonas crevioricanis]KGN94129.1 hypothetical protein HQ38_06185 [Porphyromonas crevioricanis]SJZ66463.1 hypothetical protein SAMN02745203_00477 [Porphyromonas crevioricanis]SQH73938.1 Uncharacterised protein [Porphyromonas crevioricanis]GAD04680.1 hypothetical protein PORCRE_372 [Porphyromonas crevioricanis JCM 15906]